MTVFDGMFKMHLGIVGTKNFVKCVNKGMRKRRAVQTSEANSLPEILSLSLAQDCELGRVILESVVA